ncbi:MAG: hypothetical protein ABJX82_21465, partial [Paracoccaceae bacterium]
NARRTHTTYHLVEEAHETCFVAAHTTYHAHRMATSIAYTAYSIADSPHIPGSREKKMLLHSQVSLATAFPATEPLSCAENERPGAEQHRNSYVSIDSDTRK